MYDKTRSDLGTFVEMIKEVHRRGGAICIFTHKELRGVDETDVEDEMCSAGNVLIDLRATEPAAEDDDGDGDEE